MIIVLSNMYREGDNFKVPMVLGSVGNDQIICDLIFTQVKFYNFIYHKNFDNFSGYVSKSY